jgi:hypothetical protein
MPTNPRISKTLTLPDMSDRYPPVGNPPDGYVVTFSASDGYYIARPQTRLLTMVTAPSTPYSVGTEDVTLVPTHSGLFTVNLPTSPLAGTSIHVKDFAGVAASNNINVATAQLIDGQNPYVINTNYGAIRAVFTGSTWTILTKF